MGIGYYPTTVEEACRLLAHDQDAMLVAGGTDLMVNKSRIKKIGDIHNKKASDSILFLNKIQEIQDITTENGMLKIGAGVTYQQMLQNEWIPEVLRMAIYQLASPAIRSVGTMAGNICNASPAGDTLPVLYIVSAVVVIASPSLSAKEGVHYRRVGIEEFIVGVRQIALHPYEMVVAIEIPMEAYHSATNVYYEKIGARLSVAIAKASFAGLATIVNDQIEEIRMAFGAVSTTIVRLQEVEKKLIGKRIGDIATLLPEVKREYEIAIRPIDDQRSTASYRKKVCIHLLEEFLMQCAGTRQCDGK